MFMITLVVGHIVQLAGDEGLVENALLHVLLRRPRQRPTALAIRQPQQPKRT
jgi:hypothetical protein